jgi:hypothetical protein
MSKIWYPDEKLGIYAGSPYSNGSIFEPIKPFDAWLFSNFLLVMVRTMYR